MVANGIMQRYNKCFLVSTLQLLSNKEKVGKTFSHAYIFFLLILFLWLLFHLFLMHFFLKQRMKNVYTFLYDGIQHSLMLVFSAVVHWGSKLDLRGDSCFDNI